MSEAADTTEVGSEQRPTFVVIPETEKILGLVNLGRFGPGSYRDETVQPLSDKGFNFITSQASYGYTGVQTSALPGYRVETFSINPETKAAEWGKSSETPDETIVVSADWGNMQLIPAGSPMWNDPKHFGNPGSRTGVVRVTTLSSNKIHFYALNAKFTGRPDRWTVNRGIVELQLVESKVTEETPPASEAPKE